MPPSLQLALNALSTKRARTLLLIGAIMVAAALVTAVSCTSAGVQKRIEDGYNRFLGAADVRIIHQFNGRFDKTLLDDVRAWPGVEAAVGHVLGSLPLTHVDRRVDEESGRVVRAIPDAIGYDFSADELETTRSFSGVELTAGRLPESKHEILVGPILATQMNATLGDLLRVERFGTPVDLEVVGIFDRQKLHMLQRPRIYVDRDVLAELVGFGSELTRIMIRLDEDRVPAAFCDEHAAELPEVLRIELAEMAMAGFDQRLKASRLGILVMTMMTFMSASFIIVTGLTTTVTERQRELAVMRCIGATRQCLFKSQLFVGLIFGIAGAGIGIPFGLLLSWILSLIFHESLGDSLVISQSGVILAAAGSIGAGLLGASYPAIMAARVAPLIAMSHKGRPHSRRTIWLCLATAFVLIGCATVNLIIGIDGQRRFWWHVYAGIPALFAGYFLLATPLILVLMRMLGPGLAKLLQLPRDMLSESVRRTPWQMGFTSGALMVGIAILTGGTTVTTSLMESWVSQLRFADAFAYRATGLTVEEEALLKELPCVEATCPVGYVPLKVGGDQVFGIEGMSSNTVICVGFEPRLFFEMNRVDWIEGDPETAIPELLTSDSILVAEQFLNAQDIGLGDTISLGRGDVMHEFKIAGVVTSAGLEVATSLFGIRNEYTEHAQSCVFMERERVGTHFDNRDCYFVQLNLRDGVTDEEAEEQVRAQVPGLMFTSGRWIISRANELAMTAYAVQSTVAFAALVLASIAVGNVIIAGIQGRRYEFGLLRAIGGMKGTMIRLLIGESFLLACAGATAGTLLGLHLAAGDMIFYRELAGLELAPHVPVHFIASGWLIMILMAMLATLPGLLPLLKMTPSKMLSFGRHG